MTTPGAVPLGGINSRKKSKVSNIKLAVVRTERNVTFCGKEMISSSTLFLLQHSSETSLQHHVFAGGPEKLRAMFRKISQLTECPLSFFSSK